MDQRKPAEQRRNNRPGGKKSGGKTCGRPAAPQPVEPLPLPPDADGEQHAGAGLESLSHQLRAAVTAAWELDQGEVGRIKELWSNPEGLQRFWENIQPALSAWCRRQAEQSGPSTGDQAEAVQSLVLAVTDALLVEILNQGDLGQLLQARQWLWDRHVRRFRYLAETFAETASAVGLEPDDLLSEAYLHLFGAYQQGGHVGKYRIGRYSPEHGGTFPKLHRFLECVVKRFYIQKVRSHRSASARCLDASGPVEFAPESQAIPDSRVLDALIELVLSSPLGGAIDSAHGLRLRLSQHNVSTLRAALADETLRRKLLDRPGPRLHFFGGQAEATDSEQQAPDWQALASVEMNARAAQERRTAEAAEEVISALGVLRRQRKLAQKVDAFLDRHLGGLKYQEIARRRRRALGAIYGDVQEIERRLRGMLAE